MSRNYIFIICSLHFVSITPSFVTVWNHLTGAMSGEDNLSQKKRFLSRSKNELRNLTCENDSSSTKRCTEYAVRIVREFCMETGRDQQFETLPVKELDSLLEDFFGNVIKKDGTSYQRNGLSGVRYGIARFLKKHREIDIMADREFVKSERTYKARQVELKKSGLGQVNHYLPLKEDDLLKLYSAFDITNAASLRQKVQFDFMFFFSRRDRKNLREMTKDQFIVDTTLDGQRCVRQVIDEQYKNPEQAATDDHAIMLEITGNPLCPVSTFELYSKKLNPLCKWLWQRERLDIEDTDPVWYTYSPLGKNTLASLMPTISQECGLSKTYTNHSVRATSLTALERTIAKIGSLKKSEQTSETCAGSSTESMRSEMLSEMSLASSGAVLGTPSPDSVPDAPVACSVPLEENSVQAEIQQTSSSRPSSQELQDPLPVPVLAPAADEALSMPPLTDTEVDSLHVTDKTKEAIQNLPFNQSTHHQQMPDFSPNISHSTVTDCSKVCALHFLPDEIQQTLTGHQRMVNEAIPSVFFWGSGPKQNTSSNNKAHDSKDQECNGSAISEDRIVHHRDFDYPTPTSTSDHCQLAVQHIQQLGAENQQLRALKFGVSRFTTDPAMIEFYTGFDNYKLFRDTFEVLQPTNDRQQRGSPWSAIGEGWKNESLPPMDQFFVFMCRCRAGLLEPDLAVRFGISVATVIAIITNWTGYLHCVLASLPIWPSRDKIDEHMPGCFKEVYPRMRVILETVEIKCQTSSLYLDSQLCSHRKSANIFKGLIGVTPSGAVSFLSPLYVGRASVHSMIARSGLVDKLDENDNVIVARKAVTVGELCAAKSASLSISPLLAGVKKPLFDIVQMEDPPSVARVQDHIERAIRRVKQYHIFDVAVPPSLADSVNQIWTVCCLLTNFREPLS